MSSAEPAYDELVIENEDLREQLFMRENETSHALLLMREAQEELAKVKAELEAERVKTNKLSNRLKSVSSERTDYRKKYNKLKVACRAACIDKPRKPADSARPST
jgi:hypothetical protein